MLQRDLYAEPGAQGVVGVVADPSPAMPDEFLAGPGQGGLVSAIIPAFNREALVVDALNSLAAQTYSQIQIIVVDDGSTDATAQVVKDWSSAHPDQSVELIRQSNGGASAARNAGLRKAQGEYVYFLDSDDVAEPFAIAFLHDALSNAPDKPFALGRVCNADIQGNILQEDYSGITHMRRDDLLRNHWLLFAALYRRSAVRASGPFNETLKMGEDTEFNWRVIVLNGVGVLGDKVLGQRRHHNYGHLYLNSGAAYKMQGSIMMHQALGDWFAEHPQYYRRMSPRGLVMTHNYYHREGLHEGAQLWSQVTRLFDHLSPDTPRLNALLRLCTRRRFRPVYWFGYRAYRKSRRLLRPVKRFVSR